MNAFIDDNDAAEENGAGAPPPYPPAETQPSDCPSVDENPDDRVSGEKNEEVNEPNDEAAIYSLEEGDDEDMEVNAINSEVFEQLDDGLSSDDFDKKCNSSELTQERRSSKRQRVSASNSPGIDYHARRAAGSEIKSDVTEMMVHLPDNAGGDNVKPTVDSKGGEPNSLLESAEPNYRWIGEGIKNGSSIDYQGVEINFTNMKTPSPDAHKSPFVVRIGEVVLISSDDTPWYEYTAKNSEFASSSEEHVSIYDDPASRESLGALDPFIGVIDRLWEETDDRNKAGPGPGRKKKGKNNKSSKSSLPLSKRRMMRTRWFFKKEDMEGIRGNLVVEGVANGGSKDDILTKLSPQDLILTDQYDDNVITAIMGKARVVKRNPTYQSIQENEIFICSYFLNFIDDSREVKLFSFTDDDIDNFTVSPHHVSNSITSSDPNIIDYERNGNNHSASLSQAQLSMSPTRRVASVGETLFVGKIRISENHQADIPPQLDLQRKVSSRGLAKPPSQRIPTLVWDPTTDEGDQVDTFIIDAYSLLGEYLTTIGVAPFHDVNYIGSFDNKAEAKRPREIDMCGLLVELHDCRGDARKAIRRIEADPELYLTYFNKKDLDRFDASYRIYRDSIKMIANAFGDDKSCKEVVDYQYRFKYCENFRRFMRKKREKAEEMMATVEDRMLLEKIKEEDTNSPGGNDDNDSTSSDDDGKVPASTYVTLGGTCSMLTAVPATRVGPVNNRIRTWFRTGGGDKDAVGATQQRRNNACGFLKQLREKVGEDAFDTLAKSIKTCCSSNPAADSLLLDVNSTAKDLMKSYPELLEQFLTFLPKEIRCNRL